MDRNDLQQSFQGGLYSQVLKLLLKKEEESSIKAIYSFNKPFFNSETNSLKKSTIFENKVKKHVEESLNKRKRRVWVSVALACVFVKKKKVTADEKEKKVEEMVGMQVEREVCLEFELSAFLTALLTDSLTLYQPRTSARKQDLGMRRGWNGKENRRKG